MKHFDHSAWMLVLAILILVGCARNPDVAETTVTQIPSDSLDAYLEYANQSLNEHEEKKIEQYLARHQWDLTKTPTGLRYIVYRKGDGSNAVPGSTVKVNYTLSTINGIVLSSSEKEGPMIVTIEQTDVISGLHELLQLMNQGARARAVIPSRLGYGFTGDQERIPKGATLVYDIEVISIINNN